MSQQTTREFGTAPSDMNRRDWMAYSAGFGGALLAAAGATPQTAAAQSTPSGKRYDMKKSINLWALPYPEKMTLRQCLELCKEAGFDGVELNYGLDGDLHPDASEDQIREVGEMTREIGLEIAGLCSFLFWPYSFTAEDPERRERGLQLGEKMIRAAQLLGTPDLLVVPGAVYIPWLPELPHVPPDVCDRRAKEGVRRLLPLAEEAGVYLNIENIFTNGFLHSPQEMIDFIDSFESDYVQAHFDTGNIMQYHTPEHWIPLLGKRIRHVHLKEFMRKNNEFNIDADRKSVV